MKKQITRGLSLLLCATVINVANANENDLKFKTTQSLLPYSILKNNRGNSDDGIKGKIMITGGIGFSAFRTSLLLRYKDDEGINTPFIVSTTTSPVTNVGVDYGLGKRISVGVAFAYQKVNLVSDGIDSNNVVIHDSWTRIQMAVRGDYYIVAKKSISLYTGLKVGYNMYNFTSDYTKYDPNYIANVKSAVTPSVIAAQAHFGFSVYFGGLVGLNTEVGVAYGGPYYFAAGLAVKI